MTRVLVTNDDGINAQGIRKLVEALMTQADLDIYVVAPSEERSGVGHGLTYRSAVLPEAHPFYGYPVKAWAVNGNPADCVKAAFHLLFQEGVKPDLVFSGINVGSNLGRDVYYSGTCSAAREAVILGVPAVALSYDNWYDQENYGEIVTIVQPLLAEFLQQQSRKQLPTDVFWNINIPHRSSQDIQGVAPAVLAMDHYQDVYKREEEGYWLQREYPEHLGQQEREDYRLLQEGYITVTPIHIDATDKALLETVNDWSVIKNWRSGQQ
ncbi:5'/3'-nucleotidase SurE [Brevibacillus fulvus]|uniref:5'-nucleotidase SurE n=1 Tax=Brevibacillus fulvus TaxID=1125967 RepID=A0A939BSY1_9BACL|nr:5'/3'-nucleotidase SurE [Brevibacillus fulvus]MBM7590958.1 5'-nucleotidase [Brevibacillus fulvus]